MDECISEARSSGEKDLKYTLLWFYISFSIKITWSVTFSYATHLHMPTKFYRLGIEIAGILCDNIPSFFSTTDPKYQYFSHIAEEILPWIFFEFLFYFKNWKEKWIFYHLCSEDSLNSVSSRCFNDERLVNTVSDTPVYWLLQPRGREGGLIATCWQKINCMIDFFAKRINHFKLLDL